MYFSLFLLSNLINETLSYAEPASPPGYKSLAPGAALLHAVPKSCSWSHGRCRYSCLPWMTCGMKQDPCKSPTSQPGLPKGHLQLTWALVQGRLCKHTAQAQGRQLQYTNLTDQTQLHIHTLPGQVPSLFFWACDISASDQY